MKGNPKVIKAINMMLTEELSAINQYVVHAEMCGNWGFHKLHDAIEKQSMDEMHHAEWLIARILFLEGTPNIYKLNPIKVGKTIQEMIELGATAEVDAVRDYNGAIKLCAAEGDAGTKQLLEKILGDEETHVDWAEEQNDQIQRMGLQNYLANQA